VCENSLFGRYTRANFPPAFACMRYKSSAVRGHIRFKAALFYNSIGYEGFVSELNQTSKDSKIFQSWARAAREREPMIENHQWDAGAIKLISKAPNSPRPTPHPTPQLRSSHWRIRKYWDASCIWDHWPCRKFWIDHDPASYAVRTSRAFDDQITAIWRSALIHFNPTGEVSEPLVKSHPNPTRRQTVRILLQVKQSGNPNTPQSQNPESSPQIVVQYEAPSYR
jgi:hypothetical protein